MTANPLLHPNGRPSPSRPRDAASLIVYRRFGRQVEVLLGKRHARAKFAPDVYVFPGGAVDPADYPTSPVAVPWANHMGVGKRLDLAQALQAAAIREAREETGLVLKTDVGAECLRYIGRAITPVFSPVRYHARFFAAPAELFEGDMGGDGELQHLHWVAVEQALQYPLIDVTVFMLQELGRALSGHRSHLPLFAYYGNGPRVLYRSTMSRAAHGKSGV
jgi:8-oxo-dGTP pyrophosphatase MutT (NUDIX family)